MRSADEVTFVDAVYGADLNARAATCAERVVDGREVILYCDSTVRTGLLTLHTSDTAVAAIFTGVSALIVVGALHYDACGVVHKVNNAVGALAHADSAADTLSGVYSCHTVLDGYSLSRADLYTIAVAEAGIGAELVAAVSEICSNAGL